jgi:hypothetical protein
VFPLRRTKGSGAFDEFEASGRWLRLWMWMEECCHSDEMFAPLALRTVTIASA